MKANVGSTDRLIRILLGIIFLVLAFAVFAGTLKWIFIVLGIIALFTGIVRFCALYPLLKINTAKKE
ncbi:MAG: DUF2892 domain-containing protein [Calditrichaeota bacterium]|nr:DUF2892 domain-containing protein [Calditrichota bacterium]